MVLIYLYLRKRYYFKDSKMFQRKQTLFWLAALALMIAQFFGSYGQSLIPVGDGSIATIDFTFRTFWTVTVLLALIVLIQVVVLFLFKKQALQIRLTAVNIVLMIGLQALVVYYLFKLPGGGVVKYDLNDLMPAFAALLNFFAFKRVAADYALLRSLGRLR